MNNQTDNHSTLTSAPSRKRWLLVSIVLLVGAAGVFGLWLARGTRPGGLAGRPVPTPDFDALPETPASSAAPMPGEMLITIPLDKLANAHLKIEVATVAPADSLTAGGLRTTGTVQSNAYKETPVLPIASGIVREVNAQLGDKVTRGQPLAVIFSTELADAETAYLTMQAEIERHHQHYSRMEKLVELGAVSREEFEETQATYKIEQAKLASARQRLLLLGMREKQIGELRTHAQMSALVHVEAPASGSILSRTVNAGEVVMQGKEMFRIADLSTVWVIGQIYEKDFAAVRVGTAAAITAPAYPGRSFAGRVSYIDPRVELQMRTSQVRVEVNNPGEMLRLGMFVDVNFGGTLPPAASNQQAVSVPRGAVQMIGAKQVVFVATSQAGVFAQREVSAGQESNGLVPIFAGLKAGERVVTEGSFLLRAESLKLDPSQLTAAANQAATRQPEPALAMETASPALRRTQDRVQSVTVTLGENGYQPASFRLRQGAPARVTFVRKIEATCGTEVVLEEYKIKRELPLNQPVVIEITPAKTGEFTFACGMNMLRGKILVQ